MSDTTDTTGGITSNANKTTESKDKKDLDKLEKVEVQWLYPKNVDSEQSKSDDNEQKADEPKPNDAKETNSLNTSAFFASAWSAWSKVEDLAKSAAYSAAYSAGPEDGDEILQEKVEIDCDGNPKETKKDANSKDGTEVVENQQETSTSTANENKSGFSNSPSISSISSLSAKSVGGFFSGLTSYVEENRQWVKSVAADATAAIKENVKVPQLPDLQTIPLPVPDMLVEFNREQQEFIKTKGNADSGVCNKPEEGLAPWVGYQEEEAMKAKILALSADRRTFVRAPPSGVTFDFDYASVSSTALALLGEDPKLNEMRYELVPKLVKEDEFWKNYFYRVNLIKQSFDLKDLEDQSPSHEKRKENTESIESRLAPTDEGLEDDHSTSVHSHDPDDEFVSESYQGATKKDMAEVNESMRRLGLGGGGTADYDAEGDEWEAELEGELNEFEVVSSKDGNEDPTDSITENQIQEMLDAEDENSSNGSLNAK